METEKYNNIINNIHENPKFKLKETQLYRVKDGKLLKVIQEYEVDGLLYIIKATQDKIQKKYWWNGMMKDIENYIKLCDRCQRRNKNE
ncbi:hypothetical protein C1646_805902 [Rhizophagus diaphanus]|nr:hypothetical protein C1646_805902 [Rhizophagus diaphanus] [Rhizophagus sp. MUCL 43196]